MGVLIDIQERLERKSLEDRLKIYGATTIRDIKIFALDQIEAHNYREALKTLFLIKEKIGLSHREQRDLARCYYETDDDLNAIAALEESIRQEPTYIPAMIDVSVIYAENDELAEAVKYIEKANKVIIATGMQQAYKDFYYEYSKIHFMNAKEMLSGQGVEIDSPPLVGTREIGFLIAGNYMYNCAIKYKKHASEEDKDARLMGFAAASLLSEAKRILLSPDIIKINMLKEVIPKINYMISEARSIA
jgi:hypothetical protein